MLLLHLLHGKKVTSIYALITILACTSGIRERGLYHQTMYRIARARLDGFPGCSWALRGTVPRPPPWRLSCRSAPPPPVPFASSSALERLGTLISSLIAWHVLAQAALEPNRAGPHEAAMRAQPTVKLERCCADYYLGCTCGNETAGSRTGLCRRHRNFRQVVTFP